MESRPENLFGEPSRPWPSVVLVPGMFRSGSTWCFNVVKELLLLVHVRERLLTVAREDLSNVLREAAASQSWDAIIVKGHAIDETAREMVKQRVAAIVHSYRDPADAIRSGMRAFGMSFEQCLGLVSGALEITRLIEAAQHGCVIFHDDIEGTPLQIISSIASHLRISASSSAIAAIAGKLIRDKVRDFTDKLAEEPESFAAGGRIVDLSFSYYDTETFFHRRHVSAASDCAANYSISDAQLDEIRKCFAGYVDEHGRFLIRTSRWLG